MKQIAYILLIAAVAVSGLRAAGVVEILNPPFLSSTDHKAAYIVGRTTAPLVEIWLNDKKYADLRVTDSVFHSHVSFNYGLNEIRVVPVFSGVVTGAEISEFVEILCSPDISRKHRRIYPSYVFHDGSEHPECSGCHPLNWTELSEIDHDTPCIGCHTEFKDKPFIHIDPENNDCSICHGDPAKLIGRFEGAEDSNNPCYYCHKDKMNAFDSQEFIHGPVAIGGCTPCHDPHGSVHKSGLVAAEQVLCFGCHEFSQGTMEYEFQHEPFVTGRCRMCHDPHATANKWVLVKSTETVCLTCHNADGTGMEFHRHPFNVEPKKPLSADLELSETGRLECLSCHNPHSSVAPHLLRITQQFTCIGCHAEYE